MATEIESLYGQMAEVEREVLDAVAVRRARLLPGDAELKGGTAAGHLLRGGEALADLAALQPRDFLQRCGAPPSAPGLRGRRLRPRGRGCLQGAAHKELLTKSLRGRAARQMGGVQDAARRARGARGDSRGGVRPRVARRRIPIAAARLVRPQGTPRAARVPAADHLPAALGPALRGRRARPACKAARFPPGCVSRGRFCGRGRRTRARPAARARAGAACWGGGAALGGRAAARGRGRCDPRRRRALQRLPTGAPAPAAAALFDSKPGSIPPSVYLTYLKLCYI
jgi:hypothetical protein